MRLVIDIDENTYAMIKEMQKRNGTEYMNELEEGVANGIPLKTGHCKDCKWWKDKDGVYRRGIDAESKCPINSKEVFDGNGYCYMFESRESEGKK